MTLSKITKRRPITFHKANLVVALGCILNLCSLPAVAAEDQAEFSVYCTSNFDSTGKCVDQKDNELGCTLISGNIIECANTKNDFFECIQFGSVIAHQTQFSCTARQFDNQEDPSETQLSSPEPSKPASPTTTATPLTPEKITQSPERKLNVRVNTPLTEEVFDDYNKDENTNTNYLEVF